MTNSGIGMNNLFELPGEELIGRLMVAGEDTVKVKLLLSMCAFHWWNKRNKDSLIAYAEKARKLSRTLRYDPGINEACYFLSRTYTFYEQVDSAKGLLPLLPAPQQARLLIVIGEHYLFKLGLQKSNLDTSYSYFSQALSIARSIGSASWKQESLIALGKYYFSIGNFRKGQDCFLEMIEDHRKKGDRPAEAHMWSELGIYMPDTDSTFKAELFAHGCAMKLYHALKDTANETSVMQDIAAVYQYHGNFALSKAYYLQALHLRYASGNKKVYNILRYLAWTCHAMGDLNEALAYGLEEKKVMSSLGLKYNGDLLLGQIYADYGQPEVSLHYLLNIASVANDLWNYYVARKIAEQYLILKKPAEALSFVRNFEQTHPAIRAVDKQTLAAIKGDCYSALNDASLAEKYYLQMISLNAEVQEQRSRQVIPVPQSIPGREAYCKLAGFYAGRNMYSIAGQYLAKALHATSFPPNRFCTCNLERDIRWLQFKIDSAAGRYSLAIRDYERYSALNDSMLNATKARQLQQLQVQFETEKKENEISSKDQQILALKQNDLLRQTNLEKDRIAKKAAVAAIGILLALGGLLSTQYIQKRRANKLIIQKNEQLQHLVAEKEWLLKEVHHRVKNNLYTVICLLESQAAYLENEALSAIENSQHRVYAMSLIHQKIYQAENMRTIDMAGYLPEFIQYLKESFDISRHIGFELEIDPLQLDVSRAVPIALIINEAVTNSIKHAFPGKSTGVIGVSLRQFGNDIVLEVTDNGIGLPENIGEAASNSLGVQLLKGLSEDINGQITFENRNGAKITVTVQMEKEV